MSAQSAYDNTLGFIKDQCKLSEEFLQNVIASHNLNAHQAKIYSLLIETDGKYCSSAMLVGMHHDINKNNANKQEIIPSQNEEQSPAENDVNAQTKIIWHWKLKGLNCVKNPTDDALSKCRRNVAFMLNENIELENISETRIKQIVLKLADVDNKIENENVKLNAEYISKLLKLDVTGDIQKAIGTANITHKIDEIAFNFVKFEQEYKLSLNKLNEINILINNCLVDLQLGILDENNGKMKPVLAIQQYDILTDSIVTIKQGTELYNFTRNKKKKLNKIKQKLISNSN
eukprot:327850_1